MNNFSKIINRLTNQTVSIFSTEGKTLLKNYIKLYKIGGMMNVKPGLYMNPIFNPNN